jgi:RNA polymerase sigma-70 factor, ECF subfamily
LVPEVVVVQDKICRREDLVALSKVDSADVALISRVRDQRDEDALSELYDRYGSAIYSHALYFTGDQPTAEEVTQEVFVRLWLHADSYAPERGQVRTWLMGIAHHLILSELRKRMSRPQPAGEAASIYTQEHLVDEDDEGDPAIAAWLHERANLVRGCVSQLPPPQREVIELAFFGGLSHSEIEKKLNIPLGTIKGRIRAGMQRLRELLTAAGLDDKSILLT